MKKNILAITSVILSPICAFLAFWLYFLYTPVVTDDKGSVFYLKPGTGLHALSSQLTDEGIIKHPELFHLYTRLQGNRVLKSGEYLFPKGSTPISIWSQITNGTGLAYHPFAIIPGWSFAQLRQALNKEEALKHLTQDMDDKTIMQQLSSVDVSAEGEFYPETYYYTRGESDLVLLKRAFDLMQNRLHDAWMSRISNLPYKSSYEVLISASLIEKEAYLSSERPIIAGIIINRLRSNMLLQLDPTVVYGMGNTYSGKIHRDDLSRDTPYNTYVHKGLPPTPIAIPSQSSLTATVHPQQNNYYYFVAKGDGSHQFSTSLVAHNAAVAAVINQNKFTKDSGLADHLQDLLELYNGTR